MCAISAIDIRNASWFTWKHTQSAVDEDSIEVQRALGFPNLKKGPAAVAAKGFPNVAKSLKVMAARGWPNLKKGRATEAANGWQSLKRENKTQATGEWVGRKLSAAVKSAQAQEIRQAKLLALLGSLDIREPPDLGEYQGDERRKMANIAAKWKKWGKREGDRHKRYTLLTLLSNHAIWYHSIEAPFGARFRGDGGPPYDEVEYLSRKNSAISWHPVKVGDREAWIVQLRRDVSNGR
jgi:hypothetical protein